MFQQRLLPFWGLLLTILVAYVSNVADGAAVMSVDLGSKWMKVGVVTHGVPMEIALNKESKRKTPAVLAFRDGIRTFGEDAESVGVRFPANAYGYLLDLLGKTIDNPIVEQYRKHFPYYEITGDGDRNTVVFSNGDNRFTVEELIAQILVKAKEFAQDSTQQTISECVLVVPGFFGQAERTALLSAAQLANLKVLQLINDYTAVALNYGVFNRAEINETAQYYIFYDMGAQKTAAALVSYQLVKDKATRETNPVVQVLGVGYDRNLGGREIQLRLRDFLAQEFNNLKKTKTDVTKNARAMAKLLKEAERLKTVLSANSDHFAQIENLIEDHDFRVQVTREKLEELCSDLWPRVVKPLQQAIKAAGLSLDVVNQVILFGGGTRVPKVQELLKAEIKQELGKSLNADEAATMGAAYKAADLATGFKVKKFIVKDAVLFPIQVSFERDPGEGAEIRQVKRVLFGQMNSYPQKKVITFNKHTSDFDFFVHYGDLSHLGPEEASFIGSLNLTRVQLKNVKETLEKNQKDVVESKGIKAYFYLDDSGVFSSTGVEFVFEKQKSEDDDIEGTLAKLGSTISKLFSNDKDEKKEGDGKEEKTAGEEAGEEQKSEGEGEKPAEEKKEETKKDAEPKEKVAAAKNDTVRIVVVKQPIEHEFVLQYTAPLAGKSFDESLKKLTDINTAEDTRTRRETAFNQLESHVIETQDKFTREEYENCATEEEKTKILEECAAIAEWLYEEGDGVDAIEYEKKLNALEKLTNVVYSRHWEHDERPEALKALDGMIDGAKKFLESARNLTKETNPEKDVFTQVEIETLEKTIGDSATWKKTQIAAQKKLKRNDEVRLTVKDIMDHMSTLDREVKYLVNKIKIWQPKPKPTPKKEKKNKTEEAVEEKIEEAAEEVTLPTTDDLGEENRAEEVSEKPPTPEEEATTTPHGEL